MDPIHRWSHLVRYCFPAASTLPRLAMPQHWHRQPELDHMNSRTDKSAESREGVRMSEKGLDKEEGTGCSLRRCKGAHRRLHNSAPNSFGSRLRKL